MPAIYLRQPTRQICSLSQASFFQHKHISPRLQVSHGVPPTFHQACIGSGLSTGHPTGSTSHSAMGFPLQSTERRCLVFFNPLILWFPCFPCGPGLPVCPRDPFRPVTPRGPLLPRDPLGPGIPGGPCTQSCPFGEQYPWGFREFKVLFISLLTVSIESCCSSVGAPASRRVLSLSVASNAKQSKTKPS